LGIIPFSQQWIRNADAYLNGIHNIIYTIIYVVASETRGRFLKLVFIVVVIVIIYIVGAGLIIDYFPH